jgi:hypothetical protein
MRLTDEAFLVRVDLDRFVMRIDGSEVVVSQVPSACTAMTYAQADAVVRRLRARGSYRLAHVSTLTGQPVTAEMLRRSQVEAADMPLPETRAELDRIPSGEYKTRYRNEPAFRERADQLEQQPREPKMVSR